MVRWRWVGSNFCFQNDLDELPYSKATYTHVEFKRDVLAHLQKKFDSSVKPGNKAVEVEASGRRARKSNGCVYFRTTANYL